MRLNIVADDDPSVLDFVELTDKELAAYQKQGIHSFSIGGRSYRCTDERLTPKTQNLSASVLTDSEWDAAMAVETRRLDLLEQEYRREDDAEEKAEQLKERQVDCYKRLQHLGRFSQVIGRENRDAAVQINHMLSAGWQAIDPDRAEQLEQTASLTLTLSGHAW